MSASACYKPVATGYSYKHADWHIVVSNNISRNYSMYVPTTYNDEGNQNKVWPLIVDYHGNGGTGNQQHDNSLYDQYTNDYLIAYPNGWKEHWQGKTKHDWV